MKPATLLLTALLAGSALAPAQAQQGGQTRARAVEEAGFRFAEMDADKDGIVTRNEVTASLTRRSAGSRRPMSAERITERAGQTLKGMDGDKDGKVTLAEATAAARKRFDGADANKNWVIDPSEDHARPRGVMSGGRGDGASASGRLRTHRLLEVTN